jgi:hypothetical protein
MVLLPDIARQLSPHTLTEDANILRTEVCNFISEKLEGDQNEDFFLRLMEYATDHGGLDGLKSLIMIHREGVEEHGNNPVVWGQDVFIEATAKYLQLPIKICSQTSTGDHPFYFIGDSRDTLPALLIGSSGSHFQSFLPQQLQEQQQQQEQELQLVQQDQPLKQWKNKNKKKRSKKNNFF